MSEKKGWRKFFIKTVESPASKQHERIRTDETAAPGHEPTPALEDSDGSAAPASPDGLHGWSSLEDRIVFLERQVREKNQIILRLEDDAKKKEARLSTYVERIRSIEAAGGTPGAPAPGPSAPAAAPRSAKTAPPSDDVAALQTLLAKRTALISALHNETCASFDRLLIAYEAVCSETTSHSRTSDVYLKQLGQGQDMLHQRDADLQAQIERNEALDTEAERLRSDLAALRRDAEEKASQIVSLTDARATFSDELERSQGELTAARKDREAYREILQQREEIIQGQSAAAKDRDARLLEAEKLLRARDAAIHDHEFTGAERQAQIEALTLRCDEQRGEIDQRSSETRELQTKVRKLEETVENQESVLLDKDRQIAELLQTADRARKTETQFLATQDRLAAVEQDLAKTSGIARVLTYFSAAEKDTVGRLRSEIATLRQSLDEAASATQKQAVENQDETAVLKGAVAAREEEITLARIALAERDGDIRSLQGKTDEIRGLMDAQSERHRDGLRRKLDEVEALQQLLTRKKADAAEERLKLAQDSARPDRFYRATLPWLAACTITGLFVLFFVL